MLKGRGNQIDLNGYLSQLKLQPAKKLDRGEMQFLLQFLEGQESVASMNRSINQRYEFKIQKEVNENGDESNTESEELVMVFSRGSLSKPAVRKRIKKLLKYGLIKRAVLSSETLNKDIINLNLKREKPFKITEYGLFCIMSQEIVDYPDYPVGLFSKYWKSKVLTTLLSPYFEEKNIVHANAYLHFAVVLYLNRACKIINEAFNKIKETTGATTSTANGDIEDSKQEQQDIIIATLKDDLEWHAKSFALKLLVDSVADKNYDRRTKRIGILRNLASDKKFSEFLDTVVYEVQSSYEGLVVPGRQ
jgi:DNA-binding Lrp family transcriptional regulator